MVELELLQSEIGLFVFDCESVKGHNIILDCVNQLNYKPICINFIFAADRVVMIARIQPGSCTKFLIEVNDFGNFIIDYRCPEFVFVVA